jgi:hypothetical protein
MTTFPFVKNVCIDRLVNAGDWLSWFFTRYSIPDKRNDVGI